MRMWLVNPKFMCKQHLLGEHNELHKIVGCINKDRSLEGFYKNGMMDTTQIIKRHQDLVNEMTKRGYNHKSPLPSFTDPIRGFVDSHRNFKELINRCLECEIIVDDEFYKLQHQNAGSQKC